MISPSQAGSITAAAFVSESATKYAFVCAGPKVNETISSIAYLSWGKLIGHKNRNNDQHNCERINNHRIVFKKDPCQRRREYKDHRTDRFHNAVGEAHLRIMDKLARLCLRERSSGAEAA